jgi:PAS domain-containing protein
MVDKNHLDAVRLGEFCHASQDSLPCDYTEATIIRLAAFFRNNPNPILVFNPDGEVIRANPAAERLRLRLQINLTALLPEEHHTVVQLCLSGRVPEHVAEVKVHDRVFVLTYRAFISCKVVYLSAIDVTKYRQTEAEFVQLANYTLDLVKLIVLPWQTTWHDATSAGW